MSRRTRSGKRNRFGMRPAIAFMPAFTDNHTRRINQYTAYPRIGVGCALPPPRQVQRPLHPDYIGGAAAVIHASYLRALPARGNASSKGNCSSRASGVKSFFRS